MRNAELTELESESHCELRVWSGSHDRTEMRRDGHALIEAGERLVSKKDRYPANVPARSPHSFRCGKLKGSYHLSDTAKVGE